MTSKQARFAELAELERLGLRRQQTFTGPMSYYGGQGFIDSLEMKATEKRKDYLEENGADYIRGRFPMTYQEFWKAI